MRFRYANAVTTLRLGLVAYVVSLAGDRTASAAWTVIVVATIAALLDIVDGWIARRTGTETAFGARFDMEVDALFIVILSVLAWRWEKAGGWVLLSGLLRYLFVAAGWMLPWLRQPLPPSIRRKAICVVQIVVLIVAVGPVIPVWFSTLIAAAGLGVLGYSFLVDTVWLWRHAATRTRARGPAFPSLS